MTILFLVLTLAACTVLYLSHRHQGWLAQPLAARPWRAIGLALHGLALACGLQCFGSAATIFAWLMMLMLAFSVLPFFSLLIKAQRGGH